MNCRKAERLLSTRLDSELSEKKSRRLDEHLRKCSECTERLAVFEVLSAEIKVAAAEPIQLEEKKALTEMWNEIRLHAEDRFPERKSGLKTGLLPIRLQEAAFAVTAVLAGLFIGAWFFYDGYGSPGLEIKDQTHVEVTETKQVGETELVAEAFENGLRNDLSGIFR